MRVTSASDDRIFDQLSALAATPGFARPQLPRVRGPARLSTARPKPGPRTMSKASTPPTRIALVFCRWPSNKRRRTRSPVTVSSAWWKVMFSFQPSCNAGFSTPGASFSLHSRAIRGLAAGPGRSHNPRRSRLPGKQGDPHLAPWRPAGEERLVHPRTGDS